MPDADLAYAEAQGGRLREYLRVDEEFIRLDSNDIEYLSSVQFERAVHIPDADAEQRPDQYPEAP